MEKIVPCPTRNDYYLVAYHTKFKRHLAIIMAPLTEKQEEILDNGESIDIKIENTTVSIDADSVYCYGEVDFSPASEDCELIATFDWFDITDKVFYLPSDYNYKEHTATSIKHNVKYYDTKDCKKVARYCHGCLGKPKRVVIFKT